ncbi:MAG: transketolase C-terminal domain-containing protein [Nitrospinota bacterium]|nr:transketolase C-terminal domain-containing protein [Nitrospinota bacterium]
MRPDITYTEAVREALDFCLSDDENVFVVGEGVPDPKRIFNTTAGLLEKYGPQRIMDMPLSENALTGMCIGSGLVGMRPVMIHQRTDFAYLAFDQIINNAAKWNFMFNGQGQVPMVIRMMIGRGWGQGPQHSSSPQALFSHIPGLKVVMPSRPHDAKGMLIQAIEDNGPVIFLEHRWLHHMKEAVPEEPFREPLGKARIVRKGSSLTLAAFSYSVIEATKIADAFKKHGIEIETIDMRSASPMDHQTVAASVRKTGRLLVLDTSWITCGVAAELVARVSEEAFKELKAPPARVALPDLHAPTSPTLSKEFYPTPQGIGEKILKTLSIETSSDKGRHILNDLKTDGPLDVPFLDFKGPF